MNLFHSAFHQDFGNSSNAHSSDSSPNTSTDPDPRFDGDSSLPAANDERLNSTNVHDSVHSAALDNIRAPDESTKVASNFGLRSILKHPKPISSIEQIVAESLQLLCGADDKHETRERILSSTFHVFRGLCFNQFFEKGECFSSNCDDHHSFRSHIFPDSEEDLWNASIYVINHASLPNRQIIENLICHYVAKNDTARVLLFAKCIARVTETDGIGLAKYIVNKLSSTLPSRDVISAILMLNFSSLSTKRFNTLMESLKLFNQNTADYIELLNFLNFHKYQMPAGFLIKIMEDVIECPGKDLMLGPITGFLRHLHQSQDDIIQPTVDRFFGYFGILPELVDDETPNDASTLPKKRVKFAPQVDEVEIVDVDVDVDQPEVFVLDQPAEEENDIVSIDHGSESIVDKITQVFEGLCGTWIINGECSDLDCTSNHTFTKLSLEGLTPEDVYLIADFVLSQSPAPSFALLKVLVEYLAESKSYAEILKFRKLTHNLSFQSSVQLTKLVIASLEKHAGRFGAAVKVLVPSIVELDEFVDPQQFAIDEEVLCSLMSEAVESKTSIMKSVTKKIWLAALNLLPFKNMETIKIMTKYIEKSVISDRELLPPSDIPRLRVQPNCLVSQLQVALHQGAPNKHFVATLLLKQAIDDSHLQQALDVFETFLLTKSDRARILTQLLDNCKYFNVSLGRSIAECLGTVALKIGVKLHEMENFSGTAELLDVLKNFKLNIFTLFEPHAMTEMNLAIMYCSVTIDTVHRNDTIDIFLTRIVEPTLQSCNRTSSPRLTSLTAKMFNVFTTSLSAKESLALIKGIIVRQNSIVGAINIELFVEATLRCCFYKSADPQIRKEMLRLYFDVNDCGEPISFQKVTHRGMLLAALQELTFANLSFKEKGPINVFHPLIKKILIICIKEGVYQNLCTLQPTIYSSMSAEEMKLYLLWWFALYIRGKKRLAINHFSPVTLNIIQELVSDDSRLPVHPSLRSVPTSVVECTERVGLVMRNMIAEPIVSVSRRGALELHPITVRAMSQTALKVMLRYGYVETDSERLCTGCFDKLDVELGKSL